MDNYPHDHPLDRYEWWDDYYHDSSMNTPRSEDHAASAQRLDPVEEEQVVQEWLIALAAEGHLPPRDGPEEEAGEFLEHIRRDVELEEGEIAEHDLENENSTRCAGTYEAAASDCACAPNDAVHHPGESPDEGMTPGSPLTPPPHSSSSPGVHEPPSPVRRRTSGAQGVLTDRPVGATSANGPSAPSAPRSSKRLAAATTAAPAPTSPSRRGTRRASQWGSRASNPASARAKPGVSTTGRARRRGCTPGETRVESSGEGPSWPAGKRRITVVMSAFDIGSTPPAKRRMRAE